MKILDNQAKKLGKLKLRIKKAVSSRVAAVNKRRKIYYQRFMNRASKRPILTFAGILAVLLILIVTSNFLTKPKPQAEETTLPTKTVAVYTIGESPKITVQAQVEKSGVIKMVSLGAGIVQSINVEPGQAVSKGTNILSMSTNYQGGNAFSVQRQLAATQYKNVMDTYNTQKDLIAKQRELANKNDENADKLREISNDSLGATRDLINLNNQMLSAAQAAEELAQSNNDAAGVAAAKAMRAQLMSANLQLENGLRNTEYASSDTNPPAQMSDISKDIALKQLDLQEKALGLNKEVSRLSLQLALISEAIMYPSSPVDGVVERIYVKEGQAVNPGTPIAQISGDSKSLIAVALLSNEMARNVSKANPSDIHLGSETYSAVPFYVSTEATDGNMYTAQFSIPEEFNSKIQNNGFVLIDIPMASAKTGSTIPYIPIDAVFQTQDNAFVYVAENGKAVSRKVKLGQVIGRYVEVESGLKNSDQVILNRNVINGDPVKISN